MIGLRQPIRERWLRQNTDRYHWDRNSSAKLGTNRHISFSFSKAELISKGPASDSAHAGMQIEANCGNFTEALPL
ncbi:hypothetical protein OHAE_4617 [Ochrobactrum soli]|uniref:Uncharacterized protein n=1 Tax=Ochrobactrum soli TaxID=2448455 RepID=A0A2P9HCN5_9HYPH|nr:hypothetical protein OHAE_4617 [[Ochrobactrum] soli]